MFVLLLFTGCVMDYYYDQPVSIVNNSSVRIVVEVVNDTTKKTKNNIEYYQTETISPCDTDFIKKPGENAGQEYLEESPTKTLYIFYYIDTLNKYQGAGSMSDSRNSKRYIKRLDYRLDDLKKTNWRIKYQ